MIALQDGDNSTGAIDGVIRDIRLPQPDDGLMSKLVCGLGDPVSGPLVSMSIEGRLYPRKAAIHMHKADTFRMALGEPIVVGRTEYPHGHFRLQEADSFYGPEFWTDEVGTNQLLIIADRRGAKPYLAARENQAAVDEAIAADATLAGVEMHGRDHVVDHCIADNTGAQMHAGHWDSGFALSHTWPELSDGSHLAVVALGGLSTGPLMLFWDRPPGALALPDFTVETDMLRLVVHGSCHIGGVPFGRLAFRVQPAGGVHKASAPGPSGLHELWLLGDRSGWPLRALGKVPSETCHLLDQVAEHVDATLEVARRRMSTVGIVRTED